MIDPALAAIIGALITTIGTIAVTIIQSKQEKKRENGILIPSGFKFHKPAQKNRWFVYLGIIILGGIIGYGISFLSIPHATTIQKDDLGLIRIDSDELMWVYSPRLLSDDISPDLNNPNNEASNLVETAYKAALDGSSANESYKTWAAAPHIHNGNTMTGVGVSITASGSNTEWIRISNIMHVSISYEPISDHVQLVEITGGGGTGEERLASKPVRLSDSYDNSNVNVEFPEGDFFTLQPGEVEVFDIPLECKAPGIYRINLRITYSYEGENHSMSFANFPTQVCPNQASLWFWEYGFYKKEEFFWNGSGYDQSQ